MRLAHMSRRTFGPRQGAKNAPNIDYLGHVGLRARELPGLLEIETDNKLLACADASNRI